MKSHAGFDVDKLSTLTALTEEAAASVAEALHYRMSNFSLPSNWVVQKAAAVVADGLLREYQAGNTPSLPSIPAPSIFFDASSRCSRYIWDARYRDTAAMSTMVRSFLSVRAALGSTAKVIPYSLQTRAGMVR